MAIKVKLRRKKMTKDRHSLYLDFYPAIKNPITGKLTRRQFLRLELYDKPQSPIDKDHNKETLKIAEGIRQKRDNELNKPEIYNEQEKEQLKRIKLTEGSFVDYFKKLANKKKSSNYDNWISSHNHFKKFIQVDVKFSDIDINLCNDFRDYLLEANRINSKNKRLSQNTALSYFNKFRAVLRSAFNDGHLTANLNLIVKSIKPEETARVILSLGEVKNLAKTACSIPILKKAALFSSLTGIRFSDINKLKWRDIEFIDGQGYVIHFKQQKTKGVEVLPISNQAFDLLGSPGEGDTKIFTGLKYSAHTNKQLVNWVKKAGINKHVTFHSFRHTYATLLISEGTDIYTVSKMLGHRELKTTQIYAKVLDKAKREAANKIKLDL